MFFQISYINIIYAAWYLNKKFEFDDYLFWGKVLLRSAGWFGTCYAEHGRLQLTESAWLCRCLQSVEVNGIHHHT